MRTPLTLVVAALTAAALMLAATAQARSAPEVLERGTCSGSATWKLKLKHNDGRVETEFEVDQNVVGRRWRVVLRRNGRIVFRGTRTTRAPSGSFEVNRRIANAAGVDRVVATARALGSRQVCRGAASI